MDAFVFDLGGTFLRCGIAAKGNVVAVRQLSILNFLHGVDVAVIWNEIFRTIGEYCDEHDGTVPRGSPVVVSVPTPVHDGVIFNAPTVTGSAAMRIDVAAEVARRTKRTVHVLNDVAAAAWWAHDAYRDDRIFIVTVSSGIGSKLLIRSRTDPVLDTPMYAGEIGHIRVHHERDAPVCGCGQRGHLSAVASGRGVITLARAKARRDPEAFRASSSGALGISVDALSNEAHIVPAAKAGDGWAIDVLRDAIVPLAQIVITVVLACGIERVVIIGGFAQSLGQLYVDLFHEAIDANASYSMLPAASGWLHLAPELQTCLAGAAKFALHISGRMT